MAEAGGSPGRASPSRMAGLELRAHCVSCSNRLVWSGSGVTCVQREAEAQERFWFSLVQRGQW